MTKDKEFYISSPEARQFFLIVSASMFTFFLIEIMRAVKKKEEDS